MRSVDATRERLTRAWRGCPPPARASFAFFVATLVVLSLCKDWALPHLDTARDLLLARECAVGLHCSHEGPSSSFRGLVQGALWIHLLQARAWVGMSLATFERLIDLLIAAAACTVPLLAAHTLERRATVLMWVLWIFGTELTLNYPTLWGLSPSPILLALLSGTLLYAVREARALCFIPVGLALGIAIDLHIASSLLLPFVVFFTIAISRRPWLALVFVLLVPLAFLIVDSPGMIAQNRSFVVLHAPIIVAALAAAIILGCVARPRMQAYETAERASILAWAFCVYFVIAIFSLGVVTGHSVDTRYLAPIVTPAAILLGSPSHLTLIAARRKVELTAAIVFATLHVSGVALSRWGYRGLWLHEVELIAPRLYGIGSFADLYQHTRGPDAFLLVSTLASMEPVTASSTTRLHDDLLIVAADRSALPVTLGRDGVALGGRRVALVVQDAPFVQTDSFEVCRTALDAAAVPECHAIRFDPAALTGTGSPGLLTRAYPEQSKISRAFRDADFGGTRVTYRMPLQVREGAARRRIETIRNLDNLQWKIERVDGVAIEGTLPARQVWVGGGSGGGSGSITFSAVVPSGRGFDFHAWLPGFAELAESDDQIATLLRLPKVLEDLVERVGH